MSSGSPIWQAGMLKCKFEILCCEKWKQLGTHNVAAQWICHLCCMFQSFLKLFLLLLVFLLWLLPLLAVGGRTSSACFVVRTTGNMKNWIWEMEIEKNQLETIKYPSFQCHSLNNANGKCKHRNNPNDVQVNTNSGKQPVLISTFRAVLLWKKDHSLQPKC